MDITKEEFYEWQKHPVTRELKDYIKEAIANSTEILVAEAGNDSKLDKYLAGGISAFNDCLEWSPIVEKPSDDS
jgi:hypothetical protein